MAEACVACALAPGAAACSPRSVLPDGICGFEVLILLLLPRRPAGRTGQHGPGVVAKLVAGVDIRVFAGTDRVPGGRLSGYGRRDLLERLAYLGLLLNDVSVRIAFYRHDVSLLWYFI